MNDLQLNGMIPNLTHLNCRKELHGEDLVLAVDLAFMLTRKASPMAYDMISELVLGQPDSGIQDRANEPPAAETIEFLASIASAVKFERQFENMRVSMRQGSRKLGVLGHAVVDKFALIKADQAITFRVRGQIDHASIGRFAAAMRESISMDISPAQTELELDDAADTYESPET